MSYYLIAATSSLILSDFFNNSSFTLGKTVTTPLEPNWKANKDGTEKAVDKGRYQKLVEMLIYLSFTRPDIAYAVSKVSQYMHSPTSKHLNIAYHILRYLTGTLGKGYFIQKE